MLAGSFALSGAPVLLRAQPSRLRSQPRPQAVAGPARVALGIEALERFTAGEPPSRVHQCVSGVLTLESEPVDPRL